MQEVKVTGTVVLKVDADSPEAAIEIISEHPELASVESVDMQEGESA